MEDELYNEELVPCACITGVHLNVSTREDTEKISTLLIEAAAQVNDPKLGLPNPTNQCSTCGTQDIKSCDGHFGSIKFPCTILHPYYLPEVALILNKICPACKTIRQGVRVKGSERRGCRYCFGGSSDYPRMKFKVSSRELFRRSTIIVEAVGKLPPDYWDFIPKDPQHDETHTKPNRRVLSHAQVHFLLNDVDPDFITKFVPTTSSLSLDCFLVTPNCHRVTEVMYSFNNGQSLMFDDRTRAYRKLVDFRGTANELGSRVLDCLKISKINKDKTGRDSISVEQQKIKDSPSRTSGLRWIKDVVLGKRSDHCFRTVVVGDPNIKLSEIGIPRHIAEKMQISENLNQYNLDKLYAFCQLRLGHQGRGDIHVRRNDSLVRISNLEELEMGDIIYRALSDGDVVLINRPPSIHQHSLIALTAKILPVNSVVSINPLCCSPFRGDFDGDCLHGYVPQSVDTRVELTELVALDKQLVNGQSGSNLLSLSQDSLTACYLIMEDGTLMNKFQMQQLKMLCPPELPSPAIIKDPSGNSVSWTAKQIISMFLPANFNYAFPSNGVHISNGELLASSEGSSWLRDTSGNLFQSLIEHCPGQILDIFFTAQGVLCEWLSMRGLSVSLSDLYIASDTCSRKNLVEEIFYGLQEAEEACTIRQLMLDSCQEFLMGYAEETKSPLTFGSEHFCYQKQKSAALSQVTVDAFKEGFRDVQNLAYKYAREDNSLLAMFKAGSKGNMLKLVQHGMCLGLQHSLVPLSFKFPNQLSCDAWNDQKARGIVQEVGRAFESIESYIPSTVVKSSFLTGLNPVECFVHSVTSRDGSFSNNAELPGTLNRKLMYFMRDLHTAYDGTVRNAYGNQLVQFSYDNDEGISTADSTTNSSYAKSVIDCGGGQPVGALSACAISEAAYSALDQPVSLLETSPLLNLKNILECGSKKRSAKQTMSLFLSEKLGRPRHGFEYGALEVKNHLEGLTFSDIVSTVMIMFSSQTGSKMHFSPWVSHFHISKEIVRRRRLNVRSIIEALYARCNSAPVELKIILWNLKITRNKECDCCSTPNDTFCISVTLTEKQDNSSEELDKKQDKSSEELDKTRVLVIPFLLKTVVKGFLEIKKVDIIWNDRTGSPGELYLRVSMSGKTRRGATFWNMLMDDCLPVMDMIDWSRSHPDNVDDFCTAYGIDVGWKHFLNKLESATVDIGKTILPQHLLLAADCLSATGEFVSLNAKGIAQQLEHASVTAPFMQACFSTPGPCLVKAAKAGVVDNLQGSLDALTWGNTPSLGSGGQFDIIFAGEGSVSSKPFDVHDMLSRQISSNPQNVFEMSDAPIHLSDKYVAPHVYKYGLLCKLKSITKSVLRETFTIQDIDRLSQTLKNILHKYDINESINEMEKKDLMTALEFHPHRDRKIGLGIKDIKVGQHPNHENARCFMLVHTDGTIEDVSYHKCIIGAFDIIAPHRAKGYRLRHLSRGPR
ncbi:DNA-directed RNA polymerase IV subunit 1 isoform X1 [Rosa chinensis]|uniref:DNA-directed RNA polymerase IV subunit 1 isoform X1 n=2 Tax=Rosa chinensis TaxID=74649 RepID=UPI000D094C22|nr:DNA-directed RNA polymerase IV subunit 1 isoform X1 [Rosa chinensis]XP_040367694.1 DNA-directed RNA polymerase IV subunit 1 isoform X1 [Rosa chinensis]